MATKPYQSKLIPYEDEIMKLRRRRPPTTYAQIAELLRQKYALTIQRAAIWKFIKVRKGGGRKVYAFVPEPSKNGPALGKADSSGSGIQRAVNQTSPMPTRSQFRFTPSDRYNLTRLPPEEAAARRKKLEEEGH